MKRFFVLLPITLVFAFFWSLPSYLNDSPLYYYDSGFFITVHKDSTLWRPTVYGFLIKPFINPEGLMSVIFIQNFLAVLIVSRFILVCFHFFSGKPEFKKSPVGLLSQAFFVSFILTALFLTPLVHCTNFIMTDFMTGLGILTSLMFFSIKTRERYFWLFLTLFFTITHYTHLFTFLPVFFVKWPLKYKKRLSVVLVLGAIFLYFQFILVKPKTGFGRALHYTVFSRIMAHENLKSLLGQHCQRTSSPFCEKKRNLSFHIWKRNPFFIFDKENRFIESYPEIVKLNQSFFKSFYAVFLFFKEGLRASFRQIVFFATPMEIVGNNHFVGWALQTHSRESSYKYTNARIFNDKNFKLRKFQKWQSWVFLVLTILSFSFMFTQRFRKKLTGDMKSNLFLLNLCYITHSLFCAVFTNPSPRYNSRIVWVYVLLALIALVKSWSKKKWTTSGLFPKKPAYRKRAVSGE